MMKYTAKNILKVALSISMTWGFSVPAFAAKPAPPVPPAKKFDDFFCEKIDKAFKYPKELLDEVRAFDPNFTEADATFFLQIQAESKKVFKGAPLKISCLPGSDLKVKFEQQGETPLVLEILYQKNNWVFAWDGKSYSWDRKLSFQQNYERVKTLAMKPGPGSARMRMLIQEAFAIGPVVAAVAVGSVLVAGAFAWDYFTGSHYSCLAKEHLLNGESRETATSRCFGDLDKSVLRQRVQSTYQAERYELDSLVCAKGEGGRLEAAFQNKDKKDVIYLSRTSTNPENYSIAFADVQDDSGKPILLSLTKTTEGSWGVNGSPKIWANRDVYNHETGKYIKNLRVYFAEMAKTLADAAVQNCSTENSRSVTLGYNYLVDAKQYNEMMRSLIDPEKAKASGVRIDIRNRTIVTPASGTRVTPGTD